MNKERLFKVINKLKENINSDLEQHPNIKLYVNSWVIGSLNQIESKANGGFNYYPSDATYKDLLNDFLLHFACVNIYDPIYEETYNYLNTLINRMLVRELTSIICFK